jgi:hypothetical protein
MPSKYLKVRPKGYERTAADYHLLVSLDWDVTGWAQVVGGHRAKTLHASQST